MQMREFKEDQAVVVAIEGRLDMGSTDEFEARLLALIAGGTRRMCIDCGALTFLNSTALRVFLVAAQRMGAVGGKMAISDLSADTRKIFEVIGFAKFLMLAPTREEGLRYLSAQPLSPESGVRI
jgi:anti-sigma B factor antagonist